MPSQVADNELLAIPAEAEGRFAFSAHSARAATGDGIVHAAASAFGFGGTNCHVVLRRGPARAANSSTPALPVLVTLSARQRDSLRRLAESWATRFEQMSVPEFRDAARASNAAYAGESERLWVVADSPASAAAGLRERSALTQGRRREQLPIVVGLFAAKGLSSGDLDQLDGAALERVERIRLLGGAARADVAVQAILADVVRRQLTEAPAVSMGTEDVVLEVFRGSRTLDETLAALETGSLATTHTGEESQPRTNALPKMICLVAIGTPLPKLAPSAEILWATADRRQLLGTFGTLWAAGASLRLEALADPRSNRAGGLPEYPFRHLTHWFAHVACPGSATDEYASDERLTVQISFCEMSFLRDHRIEGAIVVPGASLIDLALSQASAQFGAADWIVSDVVFHAPVLLDDGLGDPVNLSFSPSPCGGADFGGGILFEFWQPGSDAGGLKRLASGVLNAVGQSTP